VKVRLTLDNATTRGARRAHVEPNVESAVRYVSNLSRNYSSAWDNSFDSKVRCKSGQVSDTILCMADDEALGAVVPNHICSGGSNSYHVYVACRVLDLGKTGERS